MRIKKDVEKISTDIIPPSEKNIQFNKMQQQLILNEIKELREDMDIISIEHSMQC